MEIGVKGRKTLFLYGIPLPKHSPCLLRIASKRLRSSLGFRNFSCVLGFGVFRVCGFMCKTTSSTNESTNQFHWIPFPKHYLQPSGPILVWDSTKENIGLVVVLPRTYPLLVTNTLSHCCPLQRFRSRASHPVARSSPARKQRKRLGWWWHYPLLDMGFHCPNPLHANGMGNGIP